MAPELDMAMSMGMGMGMGMMQMGMAGMEAAASSSFSPAYMCGLPSADAMRVDDLLDFSNQDDLFDAAAAAAATAAGAPENHLLPLHEPPAAAANLDASAPHLSTFSDDLYIPSEEAAELEWLSKFVDDSFSDVPFPHSHGGVGAAGEPVPSSNSGVLGADPAAVPARARSKRSRAPAAALQHTISTWCSPPPFQPHSSSSATSSASSSSSSSEFPPGGAASSSKPGKAAACARKKEAAAPGAAGVEGGGLRRCTHCSSEKTPQWRTGPLGPKTLCNACGVRYKSGRLVPEYRPAASPTFVLTQHSNSHRKVMELRRQKEVLLRQHPSAAAPSAAAVCPSPRPELLYRDYEVF